MQRALIEVAQGTAAQETQYMLDELRSNPVYEMYFDQTGNLQPIDAEDILVLFNLGLIASVAHQYANLGLEWEYLLTAGAEGLLLGIRKFRLDEVDEVSTYVTYWIRQRVSIATLEVPAIRHTSNMTLL